MKKLALHFAQELHAAGLGDGIAFREDGTILGGDDWPEDKKAALQALIDAHNPDNASPPVPSQETLSDWRVGLIQNGRYADVEARVIAARDSGATNGLIAWQRFEYANHVYRAELMALKDVFGFTAEDVDNSMRWAAAVRAASGV